MKKFIVLIFFAATFLFLLPLKVSAIECCPEGYDFDNINDNCNKRIQTIGGYTYEYIDWNCPEGKICDDNECVLPEEFKIKDKTKTDFPTCSTDSGKGIDTAIGCIPIENSDALIGFILKWAIGVGGGIAFLLIVLAGFQIMTSSGNPDKLKAGQELMTSAIAGLMLLIFSVFILRIIGVDILGLPGFGQ